MEERSKTRRIELFGSPSVTIDGRHIELGKNIGLLIVLVIGRQPASLDTHSIVKALYQSRDGSPYNQREMGPEERQWARTRKHRLLNDLGLAEGQGRSFEEIAQLLPQWFTIDVVEFEKNIVNVDLKLVREAAALRRRGSLASGFDDNSGIVLRERDRLDGLYSAALAELIEADQLIKPDDAIQYLTDYITLPRLSEEERARLIERRHALTIGRIKSQMPIAARPAHKPRALPSPKTPMIGRKSDLDFIKARLRERAFVTITGPGGIGKSRLAIAALRELRNEFPDGVWFIDLADVSDRDSVPERICRALSLENHSDGPWLDLLTHYLSARDLLLVLDECERFPDACLEVVNGIASRCPRVGILATSREAIAQDASACRLGTLSLPDRADPIAPADLVGCDAVRLFIERAKILISDFEVTGENSGSILEICRELDGLPLALELAASLVDVRSVDEIASDLRYRHKHIRDENEERSGRHSSLQSVLDSHYELLPPRSRALLPRLSVFRGGFDADAAAAVFSDLRQTLDVQSLLDLLVGKSLVNVDHEGGNTRYRILNTIRVNAAEKLLDMGLENEVRDMHRDHYLELAEAAGLHLRGHNQLHWIDRLEREHDNLRAAVDWKHDEKRARLAVALWRYWSLRGYLREARHDFEQILSGGFIISPTIRMSVLNAAANIAIAEGDHEAAQRFFDDLLSLGRTEGDEASIAAALFGLAVIAEHRAEYQTAAQLNQESLAIFEQIGDVLGIANAHYGLAIVAQNRNDFPLAAEHQAKSFAMFEEAGDLQGLGKIESVLGTLAYEKGEYDKSEEHYRKDLTYRLILRDRTGIVTSHNRLGYVAQAQGRYAAAREHFTETITEARAIGDRWGEIDGTNNLANLNVAEGHLDEAVSGFGQAYSLAEELKAVAILPVFNSSLGMVARMQGRYDDAWKLLSGSLREFYRRDEMDYAAEVIRELGFLAQRQQDSTRAVVLLASYASLLSALGIKQTPAEQELYDNALDQIRTELSPRDFAEAWERGEAFTPEAAVEFAIAIETATVIACCPGD